MSRVSPGSSRGPKGPWGGVKSRFLSVFPSYIPLFTEQSVVFMYFMITIFQCWCLNNVKIIIMYMGGVNSFILLFTEQIVVFIYVVISRFNC